MELMMGKRAKGFVCSICGKQRTYGSWEDTETYLGENMTVHLGCLIDHYKTLKLHTNLARENARSLLQLIEKTDEQYKLGMTGPDAFVHLINAGVPILIDICKNLSDIAGAARANK